MIDATTRAWWHGCWLTTGHHLFDVGGRMTKEGSCPIPYYGSGLDGGFAPRRRVGRWGLPAGIVPYPGDLVWINMATDNARNDRATMHSLSEEMPQGNFLRHSYRGCTLLAWWDRAQGDTRGACNSVYIVHGEHDTADMLTWFPRHFPAQMGRLEVAGVRLVDVTPPPRT